MRENSVYKFVEFVGTSKDSWEEAVKNAVNTAGKRYSDFRVGEITKLDVVIEGGRVALFRARINISYRYHL
jgi:flavin-binding protein dodecin